MPTQMRRLFLGFLLFTSLLSVQASAANKVNHYAIAQVTQVSVQGVGVLKLTQGDTDGLRISGDEEDLNNIHVDLTGNQLKIFPEKNTSFSYSAIKSRSPLVYELTLKDLTSIELSGAVQAQLQKFTLKDLHIAMSGAVKMSIESMTAEALNIDVSGACHLDFLNRSEANHIKAMLSGASKMNAESLIGQFVYADVSGVSHIRIAAAQTLDAHASGVSSIRYTGQANVKKNSSGMSHIDPL